MEQNRNVTEWPVSDRRVNWVELPEMEENLLLAELRLVAEDGPGPTLTLKTVHIETRTGSPSHTTSNFPQLHAARRVDMDALLLTVGHSVFHHAQQNSSTFP